MRKIKDLKYNTKEWYLQFIKKIKLIDLLTLQDIEIEAWLNHVYNKEIYGEIKTITKWREVIKTPINDSYKSIGTIHYSLNGSPPKLHLIVNSITGNLVLLNSHFEIIEFTFN